MRKFTLTLALALGVSSATFAQKGDWAGSPYFSHSIIYGDTDFSHPTKSLSPGVGLQLQYGIADNLWLYGDLAYNSVNGGNDLYYYESNIYMGALGLQYDIIGAFTDDTKLQAYVDLSIGWTLSDAESYLTATDEIHASVPNTGGYTNTPIVGIGGNLSYPIHNQVDIFGGLRMFPMYENDWIDAVGSGEAYDYFAQINIGLRFRVQGHTPHANVSQKEHDDVIAAQKAAEKERDEAQAELELARARYETQIEDLYNVLSVMNNNIDSLNQKITVLKSNPNTPNEYTVQSRNGQPVTPGETTAQWRIVIGSYPTAEMARTFADRHEVEGGNYEVVYIADLDTYRVVYDSYPSQTAAKNELTRVRHTIANAWIIKF